MVAALDLSFTDAAILIGVATYGLVKIAELRGWTRSPALVRQENADLRERNATLVAEVDRLDKADRDKAERIAALEALVKELQKRDQAAVLDALRDMEIHNEKRATRSEAVLVEIRDALIARTPRA